MLGFLKVQHKVGKISSYRPVANLKPYFVFNDERRKPIFEIVDYFDDKMTIILRRREVSHYKINESKKTFERKGGKIFEERNLTEGF